MADSYIIYTASGSQDTFSIPFGYLDPDHVHVSVNNVDVTFDFPTGAQVQTDVMPTNGQLVKVYRTTPRTSREVVWQNASNLTATDLNTSDLQLLYIMQEAFDRVQDAVLKNNSGLYDAGGIRITNVGTPVDVADAATKAYVDASTVDIVDDAQDARDAALAAQTGAEAALAACQTIYDNFDDRYLGQKSSAPTLDNDGNALIDGALYYNTTDNKMYVYDLGMTAWLAIETNIGDGTVTTPKIANLAVTDTKLAANSVVAGKIADGAVNTTAKLVDGIITYLKLAGATIASSADILAGTASKLVTASVLRSLMPVSVSKAAGGTSVLFSGSDIMTDPKEIIIDIDLVNSSVSAIMTLQLGDSGGLETAGYSGGNSTQRTGSSPSVGTNSTFFYINDASNTANTGRVILRRTSGNTWLYTVIVTNALGDRMSIGSGSKTLSDTLTQVSIASSAGVFNSGNFTLTSKGL